MNYSRKQTDKVLNKFEKNLMESYNKTFREIEAKYMKTIEELTADDGSRKEVLIRRKKRLEVIGRNIAKDISKIDTEAVKKLVELSADVYGINSIYEFYLIESGSGVNVIDTLYSEAIIKELAKESSSVFTLVALDNLKDEQIIFHKLRVILSSGLTQGKGWAKISKEIQKVIGNKYWESVRIARTETTRVEAIAKEEAMVKGIKAGVKLRKQWISSIDGRTRHSHRIMNMEIVPVDKDFSNGMARPCDERASAKECCNCRCGIVSIVEGYEEDTAKLDESLRNKAYKEWLDGKKHTNKV